MDKIWSTFHSSICCFNYFFGFKQKRISHQFSIVLPLFRQQCLNMSLNLRVIHCVCLDIAWHEWYCHLVVKYGTMVFQMFFFYLLTFQHLFGFSWKNDVVANTRYVQCIENIHVPHTYRRVHMFWHLFLPSSRNIVNKTFVSRVFNTTEQWNWFENYWDNFMLGQNVWFIWGFNGYVR